MIEQTVAHYQILSRLGSGGMGVVYEAKDLKLGRHVALKFLPAELEKDAQALDRLQREARAASALNHPNICTIYEINEHEGRHFIVMELLEGKPLDQAIAGHALAIRQVLELGIQLADALEVAHSKRILHRDLKPANIFITDRGQAKVLDFGLAKVGAGKRMAEPVGAGATMDSAHLTSPGSTVGTIAYMSPEQALGEELDARSDLFSFGVVLYEMATGTLPFTGATSAAVFDAILHKSPVSILQLNPRLPGELERIVFKLLEKDRDLRYQTAAELRSDLKRLKRDLDSASAARVPVASTSQSVSVATSPRNKTVRMGAISLVALLLLAAASYGVFALLHRSRPVPFQSMNISKLTDSGNAFLAAISPDGKYVVHVVDDAGQQSLWMRHIPTNSVTQIQAPSETHYVGLSFSPDGNYIYCVRNEKDRPDVGLLYQIPVLGGAPRLIVTGVDSSITFSPDGRRFAFRRDSDTEKKTGILTADADGSHEQNIRTLTQPELFGHDPSWSPDGKTIAIMEFFGNKQGEIGQLVAVDVATGSIKEIAPLGRVGEVHASAWLPDGSGILVTSTGPNTNWSTQIGLVSYPGGEYRRVTNDLNRYAETLAPTTRDGRSLVTVANEITSNIWIMPASGTASQAVKISSGNADASDWTADGRVLSFTQGPQGYEFDLRKPDGSGKTTILAENAPIFQPKACGDGRYIVFAGYRTAEGVNVWRMDTAGGNLKQLTNGVYSRAPICSPDGQWVTYDTTNKDGHVVMKVPIDGGQPVNVSNRFGDVPTVSPDGKMIAFLSEEGSGTNVASVWVVVPSNGGAPLYTLKADPRRYSYSGSAIVFTPDGKSLAYTVVDHGVSNIWTMPLASGPPKQLTDFKSDQIFDFAWSHDGKSLALSRGQRSRDVVLLTDTTR